MSHPKCSLKTEVLVRRYLKTGLPTGPVSEFGPMPLDQARRDGHLATSSGTVNVVITVADGQKHSGENVYCDNAGVWRVQASPLTEE